MDIRLLTVCVVKKETEFLQGRILETDALKWSVSPYDTWGTRNLGHACRIANIVHGSVVLFNPAIGKTAPLKCMA